MLKDTIKKDFITAYKKKDTIKAETLKMIKSAIQYKEVDLKYKNKEISDNDVLRIIKSEAKKRKESIDQFEKAGRKEQAEKERIELEIITHYLPEMMKFEDVKKEVKIIIEELNVSSLRDFGIVMKESSSRLKGKAEGSDIKKAVEIFLKWLWKKNLIK